MPCLLVWLYGCLPKEDLDPRFDVYRGLIVPKAVLCDGVEGCLG
jgi:hypothetical protein